MTATIEEETTEAPSGGIGRVSRVIGPVVDVEFPVDEMPVPIESSVGGPTASEVSLVAIKVLRERIGRLEAEIVSFKNEHDRERLRAAQVDALTAILDIERKRFEELRRDRDQWAERAEATQQQVGALLRRRGI